MKSETIYLSLEQKKIVTHPKIGVGDIAAVWCSNQEFASKCKGVRVASVHEGQNKRLIIHGLDLVEAIQKELPQAEVTLLGEPEMVVEYRPGVKKNKFLEALKLVFLVVVVFFGASFAIMTFNSDVDVSMVLDKMYWLITGQESQGFHVLHLFYSIGIFVGIMIFYNHLSARRQVADPTPLEVQMRIYEKDVNQAVIVNESRNIEHDQQQ